MKRLGSLVLVLLATAGVVAFIVSMGSLVYPGALKWTAGSVCTDTGADPIVVQDTYQVQPGETTTNFTLYCVGDRGEFEDAGFAKPLGILILWAVAATSALVLGLFAIGMIRRVLRGSGSQSDSPPAFDPGGAGTNSGTSIDGGTQTDLSDLSGPAVSKTQSDEYGGQPPLIS